MRVLFLLPYPLQTAASQRFRMEALLPVLNESDFEITTQTFYSKKGWYLLYRRGHYLQKIGAVLTGFIKRLFITLFQTGKYDFVVVHREASPLGPPVFEWIVTKLWRKRVIYDFDDAIWIPNISDGNRLVVYFKCFWKVKFICKWAYKVSAGNDYLAHYAKMYNNNTLVIPTVVDTKSRYHLTVEQEVRRPSVGWTGSHSTLKYLNLILPVLKELEAEFDFDFIVICDKVPDFFLKSMKYVEWNEASEIDDLKRINIGIMPLERDEWSEGKCGFKIIQYLALGIPAVATPVGVNKVIINNENGILCSSQDDWRQALSRLISNADLRKKMGAAGKARVVKNYSVEAVSARFLGLFG